MQQKWFETKHLVNPGTVASSANDGGGHSKANQTSVTLLYKWLWHAVANHNIWFIWLITWIWDRPTRQVAAFCYPCETYLSSLKTWTKATHVEWENYYPIVEETIIGWVQKRRMAAFSTYVRYFISTLKDLWRVDM